jgi:hypothetical protein
VPKLGSAETVEAAEARLNDEDRYVDLAVRLRVLNEDGTPGRLLDGIIGGRWDRHTGTWVEPTPADLRVHELTIQEQQIGILPGVGVPLDTIFEAILGGRQAGKSRIGLMDDVFDAIRYPGAESFIVSLDFKASREPEKAFASMLAPWWHVKHREADRQFIFPHGHVVNFRSAEAADSCRGASTKKIHLDEASRMSEAVYTSAVGSGAASQDFKLLVTTTPNRECRWLRERVEEWEKEPGCAVRRLKTELNPRRNKRLLAALLKSMPRDVYEEEMEGRSVPPSDAAYPSFKRELHYLDKPPPGRDVTNAFAHEHFGVEDDDRIDYLLGWDFGHEAAVWAKVYRERHEYRDDEGKDRTETVLYLWIVGESVPVSMGTEEHAVDVLRRLGPRAGKRCVVITDAMGAHDNAAGKPREASGFKQLRRAGFEYVYPVAKRDPDTRHRRRAVQALLWSAETYPFAPSGLIRLRLKRGACPQLAEAFENQRQRDGRPVKGDDHDHVLDAAGYLSYRCFPVRYGDDRDEDLNEDED